MISCQDKNQNPEDMAEECGYNIEDLTEMDDEEHSEFRTSLSQDFINELDLFQQCEIIDNIIKKYGE
jgi:hypothetical protein